MGLGYGRWCGMCLVGENKTTGNHGLHEVIIDAATRYECNDAIIGAMRTRYALNECKRRTCVIGQRYVEVYDGNPSACAHPSI